LNNKVLFLILAALVGIFLLSKVLDSGKRTKSFNSELIAVDTAKITSIVLHPKADNHAEVRLEKSGNTWSVKRESESYAADQAAVSNLLPSLAETKVKRLVARSSDKWEQYEVTDSLGTRVQVNAGAKSLADFVVGKFNFQQQPQSITSFVRKSKEDDVFAVEGFLSMSYNRGLDAWRDKSFVDVDPENITRLEMTTPDGTTTYEKTFNTWSANGTALDSLKIANYLNGFKSMKISTFDKLFEDAAPNYQLIISGNNMSPIEILCFEGEEEGTYILNSNQHDKNWAGSDAEGLFKQIFGDAVELLK